MNSTTFVCDSVMDKGLAVEVSTKGRSQSLGALNGPEVVLARCDRIRGSTWLFKMSKSSGSGTAPSIRRHSYYQRIVGYEVAYIMGDIVFGVVITDYMDQQSQGMVETIRHSLCWAVKTRRFDMRPPVSLRYADV